MIDGCSKNMIKYDRKISIIVPIYNVEIFLDKCLNSIREQSYSNFEVLLIDDGSQDCSSKICKQYCCIDLRFKYLYKDNGGVSSARNRGLQMATGEYVCFVDSDDYIDEKYLETLVRNVDGRDMAICGYYMINSLGDIIASNVKGERVDRDYTSEEYAEAIYTNKHNYQGYIWNKIFKLDIIKENHISFSEDFFYNEDRLFVLKYLLVISSVSYSDIPLYRYLMHDNSAMGKTRNCFNEAMITELDAFQNMQDILIGMWKKSYNLCLVSSIHAGYSLRKKCRNDKKINRYINRWFIKAIFTRNIPWEEKLKLCYGWLFR